MNKLVILQFLLIIIYSNVIAQSNYKKGEFIELNGNVVHGYIDYRDWTRNPAFVRFKLKPTDKAIQRLNPKLISSFTVDDIASYVSYSGIIFRQRNNQRDTVFLKVLVKDSKISLFEFENELDPQFFISEAVGVYPIRLIQELDQSIASAQPAPNDTLSGINYKKQIFDLALKYNVLNEKVKDHIDALNYQHMPLVDIVEEINGNGKSPKDTNHRKGQRNFQFFVGAGINAVTYTPNEGGQYQLDGGKKVTSYSPRIALGVNLYPNPGTRKLILRAEFGFGKNQYKSIYTDKSSPEKNILFSFSQSYLTIDPQIIYNVYNAQNFKFFAGLGFAVNLNNYSKSVFTLTNGQPTGLVISPIFTSQFATAFQIKTGVCIFQHIELYLAYVTSNPVTKDPYFNLSQATLIGGLNYLF